MVWTAWPIDLLKCFCVNWKKKRITDHMVFYECRETGERGQGGASRSLHVNGSSFVSPDVPSLHRENGRKWKGTSPWLMEVQTKMKIMNITCWKDFMRVSRRRRQTEERNYLTYLRSQVMSSASHQCVKETVTQRCRDWLHDTKSNYTPTSD